MLGTIGSFGRVRASTLATYYGCCLFILGYEAIVDNKEWKDVLSRAAITLTYNETLDPRLTQ